MPIIEFSKDNLWPPERRAAVQDRIESVKQYGRHLNRKEREFLESIEQKLAEHGSLTTKQEEWLDQLYETKLF